MFSNDVVIRVEGLGKCYQMYDQPRDRLKQFVMPGIARMFGKGEKRYYKEFWALRDVSFTVKRGETVGVIGRNGGGKSTLLQMICGTLTPTTGTVETSGRIAALLELGSGFNPEFTGRENVYLNAAVLGLTQEEVDERFDKIVDFADIGPFIDRQVKTYSSGMMVRLAFAVQAQVDPDILIVDEALAVGDAKFQAKCFDRLNQLKKNGTSILLVTHSSDQIVTHCDRAVLLNNGEVFQQGLPKDVVNTYLDLLFGRERKIIEEQDPSFNADSVEVDQNLPMANLDVYNDCFNMHPNYNPHEYRWGDGAAAILDFSLDANGEAYPAAVSVGDVIDLRVSVRFFETLIRPILGVTIKTKEGVTVYGANSETLSVDEFSEIGTKGQVMIAAANFSCNLAPGDYFLSVGIATRNGEEVIPHDRRYDSIHIQVRPNRRFFGLVNLGLSLNVEDVF